MLAAGVPASFAVPSPLSTKVTPPGRPPLLLMTRVGPDGMPVVVTVKLPS